MLCVLLLLGLVLSNGRADNIAVLDEAIESIIDSNDLKGGFTAAFTTQDGFFYATGQGPAKHDSSQAVDPETTIFRWASVSKSVVGIVALFLSERGEVDLDLDISNYYTGYTRPNQYLTCIDGSPAGPRFYPYGNLFCRFRMRLPEDDGIITLRRLLGHRGGIQHYSNGRQRFASPSPFLTKNPEINTGMEWAFASRIQKQPLVTIPGETFSYSTFGFNLAAIVLEYATGRSFASLIQEFIAEPLGLDSMQPDYEWDYDENLAEGFDFTGFYTGSDDVSWKLGGGGLRSTLVDFARYGTAIMSNTTWLPESLREKLFVDDPNYYDPSFEGCTYNMGLDHCFDDAGELYWVQHSGAQQKTRTLLSINMGATVNQTYGIFIMTNSENANVFAANDDLNEVFQALLASLNDTTSDQHN